MGDESGEHAVAVESRTDKQALFRAVRSDLEGDPDAAGPGANRPSRSLESSLKTDDGQDSGTAEEDADLAIMIAAAEGLLVSLQAIHSCS